MNEARATLWLIALFGLRCVVPVFLTMGFGYLMNRLVDKWEVEVAEQETAVVKNKNEVQRPLPTPTPIPVPSLVQDVKPTALPCWLVKGCDPIRRLDCPAAKQRGKPCWVARMQAIGTLPEECPDCPLYQPA